jgi:hypothetical protein
MQELRVTVPKYFLVGLAMACMPLVAGCGKKNAFEFAPVSGVVTLDGRPVPYTRITFTPQNDKGVTNPGPGSTALCNDDGTYSLKTARGDEQGAVVGSHVVHISSTGPPKSNSSDSDVGPPPKEAFPAKFNSQTELTFTVPAGGTTTADFPLKSKP